jgi:quinol monooxygenase YgiN
MDFVANIDKMFTNDSRNIFNNLKDEAVNMSYLRFITIVILMFVGTASVSTAQESTTLPAYTVSYLDLNPSDSAVMLSAMNSYRTQSTTEAGYGYIHLFEQVGWPGHFAVIEMWADEDSLAAHLMNSNLQQFQERLEPVRVSGYDQRPYIPLSIRDNLELQGEQERFVITHVDIGPGGQQIDTTALLGALAENSRAEQGNMSFDVLQHSIRGNHFTVIERWQNQAALETHAATLHTREFRDTIQPLTGSPLDQRLYVAID